MSKILKTIRAVDTSDGDGVKLKRVFGFYQKEEFDPFLLLDHAKSEHPQSGFPWHPHRGIETITYLMSGRAFHEDSLGNKGTLNPGDIQWMSAGSGILHQEFPDKESEDFQLLQFWLNIPADKKMTDPTYTYTNVLNDNVVELGSSKVSVIAGEYKGVKGPVQKPDRNIKMIYTDLNKGDSFVLNRVEGTNAFIYVLDGEGKLDNDHLSKFTVYKLDQGEICIQTDKNIKLIYAEGNPLNEPIEWYGPIVMNTRDQIKEARRDLQKGTFLRSHTMESIR